ncbi:unnamed protein product [Gadus morhua 'NCC']
MLFFSLQPVKWSRLKLTNEEGTSSSDAVMRTPMETKPGRRFRTAHVMSVPDVLLLRCIRFLGTPCDSLRTLGKHAWLIYYSCLLVFLLGLRPVPAPS